MKLSKLIEGLEIEKVSGDISCDIKSIAYHSQKVEAGSLFVAIKGLQFDGHHYISEAIAKGAKAILLEDRKQKEYEVATVVAPDTRYALAKVAGQFYDHPSRKLRLTGITGTNGKTTTLYLIESIFKEAGIRVGTIGTIDYRYGERYFSSLHTTPESLDLQRILRDMLNEEVTHVVMEVSSHALDLSRLEGSQFDVAVFTNLTQDHLDYHKNIEDYFRCKERLFSQFLGREKQGNLCWGVINWDDPRGELLLDKTEAEVITYGIRNKAEVSAKEIELDLSGIRARIVTPRGNFFIKSPLLGELNLYNILAAVGVGISQKLSLKEIKGGIEKVKEVPGRLERIENNDGILILIDYAHTSDALEKLLSAVEGFASGRVISVFGCGGDRDRKKRPLMGATAARHSDLTVITSDNPRSEDPLRIISEIEEGIEKCQARRYYPRDLPGGFSQKGYVIVTDRKEAIKLAINLAESGDLVTIAGKGHENYQIIGNKRIPFDDQAEVREALARKETRKLN